MKVLHVTRDFPPRVNGGISNAVGGIVRASRDAGVQVAVLSFDAWRPRARASAAPLDPAQDVFRLRGPADLDAAQRFAAAFSPDVVHRHSGLVADAVEVDAPAVFSVHVAHGVQRRLRGLRAPNQSELAQRRAIERSAAVLVPSTSTENEVRMDHPHIVLHSIPLGVDLPARRASGAELLYVGRLADMKGTEELFDAIGEIDAPLVVAGGLPDNARAERRWRERAPDNVVFTGWLDAQSLAARYARARMLIAPSWHETFGLAVAEAMSHGVPPIVSDAGALTERVEHEQSGLVVGARDPAALVVAIQRLRTDDDLHETLATGAREAARAWTWSACADALIEVYRSL